MKYMHRLSTLAASAALLACLTLDTLAAPLVRIMPVGDSITDGSSVTNSTASGGPGGGYRLPLWQRLTNAAYTVDYVGLLTINASPQLPDSNHEGHSGWKIDQIYSNMVNVVFGQTEDPDVILIMIGTNDFGQNYDVNNATNRMNTLITLLTTRWPHCKVVVASLTKRGEPLNTNIQTNFNNSLPGIVSNFAAAGKQVTFTDMYTAVPVDAVNMPDSLHPNTTGYGRMATNWFAAVTNVISPVGTTNAPAVVRARAQSLSNVVVKFSKPVLESTATNIANYAIAGLTILGATLETNAQRDVTLTTTPLTYGAAYTATVSDVTDFTPAATAMEAPTSTVFDATFVNFGTGPVASSGVFANVPEAADYQLVYSLNIPSQASWASAASYDVDLKAFATNYTRVAYYLELQTNGGLYDYAWVSFDAMTTNAARIGVPTAGSGATFQQRITNMTVLCTATSVVNGTNLAGGNIEFWPINYAATNSAGVTNASNGSFDWGDSATSGNYGSMQVHHSAASHTILAFNHWGGGVGTNFVDIGIGNRPGNSDVDWTFAANANTYVTKRLQVFVLPTSYDPPVIAAATAPNVSNVLLSFSMSLQDDATNVANYVIDGIAIQNAALDPATRTQVTLTTTPLLGNTTYTATVNNVRGISTNSGVIATNSLAVFRTTFNGAQLNVSEAADYQLVYSISLPVAGVYTSVVYDVDLRAWNSNFSRVAYYLELQTNNGLPQFAWTSFEAPTNDVHRIGIPTLASGGSFQQPITNLNIFCSVTSVVTGTGLTGGNIEFWPQNYNAGNTGGVQNASSNNYDFGDNRTNGGNYGSMQIHNHDAVLGATTGQVVWVFNRWGGTSAANNDLGIGNRPGTLDIDWTFAQNSATYTSRILQVYALPATNLPPVVAEVSGGPSRSNVLVQFSEQVTDNSANPTNFTIAGLTVLSATLDPVSKARVTLTTSPQTPATTYTLTIGGGVADRSSLQLPLSGGPNYTFVSAGLGAALNNVPEAAGYTLVYSLNISNLINYSASVPAYTIDNRAAVTNLTRIAYYLELARPGLPTNFVWVSMDAFAADAGKIGVPVNASGASFQQPVTNLTVLSSVYGVSSGSNLSGNIEFWPNAYATTNSASVGGASDALFDGGDQPVTGNYGSMQIHNGTAGQTVFAYNNWGAGGIADLGIGSPANHTHPDWTGIQNGNGYTTRLLQVYVQMLPDTTPPTLAAAEVSSDRLRVTVTFSEPLADQAANTANFTLDNGAVVSAAVLSTNLRQIVLSVSALSAGTNYTLTVNNVRDRSVNANVIAPGSTILIASAPLPANLLANAPEAAEYQLVYMLPIPGVATNWNVIGTPYAQDHRHVIGPFSRVGYYLELATNNGPTNWVWVSMDAFTNDVNKIGVPDMALAGGPIIQQRVTNLTVLTSATNVTTGTNMIGGNLEFWPYNYATANGIGIPGANAGTYDFGDTVSANASIGTSGHASMQVHNYAATQTVFAMNHWGGGSPLDLGIGTQPTGAPDWTNGNNATNYTTKNLYILVKPLGGATGPLVARVQGTPDLARVLVSFDQPLEESSVVATNFAIAGLTVSAATLRTNLHDVVLATSPQTPETSYALTVANVRDRSTNLTLMASPIVSNFTALSLARIAVNAPESTNFTLVYGLSLAGTVPGYNTNGITYGVDLRPLITQNFNRVAYYMELATNGGPTNWIYVSTVFPSTNINRIAVPVLGTGAGFQQRMTNTATVLSSVAGIATGTAITTLNLEFYPLSYTATTSAIVTGGASTNYDWNDTASANGGYYAAMQIHNFAAGQTLFAFNRWGSAQSGFADLGIGNMPATNNTDWTFAQNATNYVTRNLYVFIRQTNTPTAAPTVTAPVIVTHPTSRTNVENSVAILASLASGTGPITYQWRKNGSPVATQTNSWLVFSSVQLSDAGSYSVIASNSAGVATSLVAVLSVTSAPAGGYDAWAAQIGNGLTNYNDSAAGDGYPNLLKYATGSNPTNSDGLAEMNGSRIGGVLSLQFRHDTNATDITLVVEGANAVTNNADWQGIATNIAGSWGSATNVSENTGTQPASVTVQDTQGGGPSRFLRLRVTRP